MQFTVEEMEDVKIVTIADDYLDSSNAQQFRSAVQPVLATCAKVVFDLSNLRFVDSSGIGVLLSCRKQVSASGGDLKLCGVAKQVRVLFELVRLHRVFEIFNEKGEAVRAFAGAEVEGSQDIIFQEE
jgi:anti-sigma B factor antagonist